MIPKSLVIDENALIAAGVPRTEASELLTLGLPVGDIGHLECRPILVSGSLVLAYDNDVPLVVSQGQVRAKDGTDRLVNTSVVAFARTVNQYATYVDEVRAAKGESHAEEIAAMHTSAMKHLDPAAFQLDDSYWPIVCAQMLEGNL